MLERFKKYEPPENLRGSVGTPAIIMFTDPAIQVITLPNVVRAIFFALYDVHKKELFHASMVGLSFKKF